MFILSINEPHWDEPIVSPVHNVEVRETYTRHTSRHGDYVVKHRVLIITHAKDREVERYKLFPSATIEVTLDPNYAPDLTPAN